MKKNITVFTPVTLGSRLTMVCLQSASNNVCSYFAGVASLISLDSDDESDEDTMDREPLNNLPSNTVNSDLVVGFI